MRVAYVVHRAVAGMSPDEVLDRWPTMVRTLDALARRGVEPVAVCATDGGATRLERNGVRYHFVHDDSRSRSSLARAVGALAPDVVHVNGFVFPVPTMALRVACGRRPAIVVQHHGEAPAQGRTLIAQRLAARIIDGGLFTGANEQARPFVAAGALRSGAAAAEVLEASADLVPIERRMARLRTAMRGDPAVIWVGRLNDGKDPVTAVRAFAALARRAPDAQLWMLYQDATLERDVHDALRIADADADADGDAHPELDDRVHLVGAVPHDEMAAWFSSADIALSTSRHEAAGFSLLEALACGCTPVVTDIAPHRAIVGNLGRRFAPGDIDGAATALATVDVLDRAVVRDDFERRLSWHEVARQLLVAYETALARRSPPVRCRE